MLDFTVFMDVDPQTQLDRRLYRDQETRGYSRESILYQWEHHVIPCFEQFLMPYEDIADFHFKNDNLADQEFDRLLESLSHKLEWSNVKSSFSEPLGFRPPLQLLPYSLLLLITTFNRMYMSISKTFRENFTNSKNNSMNLRPKPIPV